MKENKYDDPIFFDQYSHMARSVDGLASAGEWHIFQQMLPNFNDKRVLDLGCGYGWHCQYAAEQGAKLVVGVDLSEKMLAVANSKNKYPNVSYQHIAIEDINFAENSFDVVISSLAFHYIQSFNEICQKVKYCLINGGDFIFSVEHPVFTAQGKQDWIYDQQQKPLYWPVDHYFAEGKRQASFLGEEVTKYHRTLTHYLNKLLQHDFQLTQIIEPQPDPKLLEKYPEYSDELRRPMFLLIAAKKT